MKKQKVLLVQDARTQGNSTKLYLEHSGHAVVWAGSGMSALLAAGKHAVDLILIDLSLPDIDGTDLCQRFRSRRDSRAIPIILFTAHEPVEGAFRRRSDGPDAYLVKPFSQSQLTARIDAVLTARAAEADYARRSEQEARRLQDQKQMQKQAGAPARPDVGQSPAKSESLRTMVPGPRSALKPKPDLETELHPILKETVPQQTAKPVLRLVPKPQPSAAEEAEAAASPQPVPSQPPFPGFAQEVIDPSTGLFSMPQFEAMFSKEFKRAVRFKQQMSCMLIDLDGSAMGRRADEKLVRALIGVVQRTIREVDTAAWWTGGALIVLLPNTMRNDAVQAGMRILAAVAEHPFTWPDATQVMVSIGVAGLPDRKIDSERKMIDAASAACRRARETMRKQQRPPAEGGKA